MRTGGAFATATRGVDAHYVSARRAHGVPDSAIARMGAWCLSDVAAIPRIGLVAEPRPEPAPVRLRAEDFPDIMVLLEHLAEQYGVTTADILGPSHKAEIVAPRHEAMAVVTEMNRFTLRELGEIFRKDHNSIVYGLARHYQRLLSERDWS